MCYLCLSENPFSIPNNHVEMTTQNKKARAALIKGLLKELENYKACTNGAKEIAELKLEQYSLSKDI